MDDAARTVVGNFTVTLNLTQARGINMTGYIYSDDTPDQVNARVDSFQDVLDRQFVRADVVNKEAQIAAFTENLEQAVDNYEALVALQSKGKKMTSQQLQNMNQHDTNVTYAKKQIASLRAAVTEAKKKLNGSAVGAGA